MVNWIATSTNQCNINTKANNKIGLFFSYLLLVEIISLGVNSFVNEYISLGTIYDSLILYATLGIFFLMSSMEIIKRINAKVILFVLVTLMFFLTNLLLHDNANLAEPNGILYLFIGICLMIPIGATLQDFNAIYLWFSRLYWIAILCGTIHLYFQISKVGIGGLWMSDMTSGYSILPAVLFAIDYAFHKKIAWLWAALGFITTLLLGSRGPMVIIFVFLIISFIRYSNNLKRKIIFVIISLSGIVFYSSGLLLQAVKHLSHFLANYNIRIAAIVKILEYDDFSNGRQEIYSNTIHAIWDKPIWGNGLFFDRSFSAYTHNLFLEILLNFGIVIGLLLIAWLSINLFKLIKNTIIEKESSKLTIIILFAFCVLGELFFSSSYIHEPFFFILLGIMVSSKSNYKSELIKRRDISK